MLPFRRVLPITIVLLAVLLFLPKTVLNAIALEEYKNEWAFGLSAVDTEDIGNFTEWNVRWAYVFPGGYIQLGVRADAFDTDFDDPFIADEDGSAFGPLFIWNWTPDSNRATGFIDVSVQSIGGDLGDFFDSVVSVGVGVRAFVGDRVSINVVYESQEFQGASGFEDLDQNQLAVLISFFALSR